MFEDLPKNVLRNGASLLSGYMRGRVKSEVIIVGAFVEENSLFLLHLPSSFSCFLVFVLSSFLTL